MWREISMHGMGVGQGRQQQVIVNIAVCIGSSGHVVVYLRVVIQSYPSLVCHIPGFRKIKTTEKKNIVIGNVIGTHFSAFPISVPPPTIQYLLTYSQ
jgi:hypothetical protein